MLGICGSFIKCFPVYLSCLFVVLMVFWAGYWLWLFGCLWLCSICLALVFDAVGLVEWFVALYFYVAFVVVFCCE